MYYLQLPIYKVSIISILNSHYSFIISARSLVSFSINNTVFCGHLLSPNLPYKINCKQPARKLGNVGVCYVPKRWLTKIVNADPKQQIVVSNIELVYSR